VLVYGILLAIFLAVVVGLIAIVARKDRYAEMTEEEFQKEAERSTRSLLKTSQAHLGPQSQLF